VQVELEPGASADAVRSAVAARLGDGFDVETRAEQIRASKEELAGVVNVFTYVLLGFAVVSLLVGGFLVVNTFSMLVAQRSREMALLRAVGARRRQVTRALLLEAGVLGLVGALLGAVAGVGVALGLAELLGATGLDLTITPSLPPTAIVASLVVGVGVTLAAAYLPTRRAGRIAPVQALRESVSVPDGPPVRRLVIGLVLLALSAAAFVVGERADGTGGKAAWAGLGGLVLVAAAVALTPAVAALLTRVLPRSRSAAARLARANTVRNPRRTAATASALMVGLALVTGVTVVASSITASIGKVVDDDDFKVDYAVSASFVPVQPALLQRIEAAPGVGSVVTQQGFQVLAGGTEAGATANGGAPLSSAFAVERVAGRVDTVAPGTFIADEETAEGRGWTVGSEVPFTFVNGAERTLRLAGTYTGTALVSGIQTDLRDYRSATGDRGADVVFVTAAPGASKAELKAALDRATADNPLMRVEDREAVKDRAGSSISTLLGLIYGLLLLSMIIAVLGVVNTMAMSVLERTREIGLLRAIGLTRRQSRAMVRRESVLVSLLGAVLGVATGLVVGTMLQRALAGTGIDQLAIPYGSIAAFFVLSALIGVVAALAPARRAARMDVLQAVAAT
jgi:putative ABC transport system permease protein